MLDRRRRKTLSQILSFLLIAQSASPAWSAEFQVFQKTYVRTSGTPVTDTDSFSVLSANTNWTLNIINGDPLVKSATATINGVSVLTPNQLYSGHYSFNEGVTLSQSNQISATMHGQPTGNMTLQITGTDNGAPVLAWTAPTAGQISQTASVSASLHLTDDVSGINPSSVSMALDNTSVTSSFSSLSSPSLDATLTASLTVSHGTHTLTAQALDVAGNSAQAASVVFVYDRPPVANAGANQSVNAGTLVTLDGTGSNDPDNDPLTYQWTLQKPSGSAAVLANPTSAHSSFTPDIGGTYTAQLVVNDGWLSSSASQATIQVAQDTTPPVLTWLSPQANQISSSSVVGASLHLTDDISGIQPSSISISLDNASVTSSFSSLSSPSLDATLSANLTVSHGTHTLTAQAQDVAGNSAQAASVSFVYDRAPIANAGSNQSIFLGSSGAPLVTLDGTGSSDPDNDPLTYQWTLQKPSGSSATLANPASVHPSFTPDVGGTYTAQLVVNDGFVNSASSQVQIQVTQDTAAPILSWVSPQANAINQGSSISAQLHLTDDISGLDPASVDILLDTSSVRGSFPAIAAGSLDSTLQATLNVPHGSHSLSAVAKDRAGNQAQASVAFVMDRPPVANAGSAQTVTAGTSVALDGSGSSDPDGDSLSYLWSFTSVPSGSNASLSGATSATPSFTPDVAGSYSVQLVVSDGWLSSSAASVAITANPASNLPPDPSTVAPPLNQTSATPLSSQVSFLYSGPNPIQTGVSTGTISAIRVGVIRGRVLARDGSALTGATISILNHPEFGQTLSRADGMYDMAVNGGGPLTVSATKDGFLPVQRQVEASWQDFAIAPDVVMIPLDTNVTAVQANGGAVQVARGGVVGDASGVRQQTLLFMPGTTATMVMPNGSGTPLTSFNVRATEYTIGSNGPQTMPAQLPPTSAYTYAVELSADEAIAAGATSVQFNQPVPAYLENFLGMPVGAIVPVGYYDKNQGAWIPSTNGRVVKILSVSGGSAQLDVDGSGNPASSATLSAMGISSAELTQLASLYSPGQTLWRAPFTHFTLWDLNWFWKFVGNLSGLYPNEPPPVPNPNTPNTCHATGSDIQCQNQIVGESVGVTGTPFSLHYGSDRAPGYIAGNSTLIQVSGSTFPASAQLFSLSVNVAGEQFVQSYGPQTNLSVPYTWNGKNAFGQFVQGAQEAQITLSYVYGADYGDVVNVANAFGTPTGAVSVNTNSRILQPLSQKFTIPLGHWNHLPLGLGGWDLDVHQSYDPTAKVLYQGDGTRRDAKAIYNTLVMKQYNKNGVFGQPVVNGNAAPWGMSAAPDGNIYVADFYGSVIRKIDRTGAITTVAGSGQNGSLGDGGQAVNARLFAPEDVAAGSDGSFYIADTLNHKIRRVAPNGIITTIAGTGSPGFSGDEGSAVAAQMNSPAGVAVAPDGSVYVADTSNNRIRKITTDGLIHTVTTGGGPNSVAVAPDGSIYYTDPSINIIRHLGIDGTLSVLAGVPNNSGAYTGDGGVATSARLSGPRYVAVDKAGNVLIADQGNGVIRMVDTKGIINTVAGNNTGTNAGSGAPAVQQTFVSAQSVTFGPDRTFYVADVNRRVVQRIYPAMPEFGLGTTLIPSSDGSQIYVFNPSYQHTQTLNALTHAPIYNFGYDSGGRLASVTDGDGNATTIQRDGSGNPLSVTAPFGQVTSLSLDSNGYLAQIQDPQSQKTIMTYDSGGLMQTFKDPNGGLHNLGYDSFGRLTSDGDPAGGGTTLNLVSNDASGFVVHKNTAMGRSTNYGIVNQSNGSQVETNTGPDGLNTVKTTTPAGKVTTAGPDGTQVFDTLGPDPRWGMTAPLMSNHQVRAPSGLTFTTAVSRQVSLADPSDLLSLNSQTDTVSVNGRNYTTVFSTTTATFSNTTPAGRISSSRIDGQGRVVFQQTDSLNATNFVYDSQGRLSSVAQGTGPIARTTSFTYNSDGRLDTITDPLNRQTSFVYDQAGRVTSQTLAGSRTIGYSYDANGNVTSITPPGQPAHAFQYDSIDQETQYTPPVLPSVSAPQTTYAYNLDRQPTLITRPDGQTIGYQYDFAGRISTTTIPGGAIRYAYSGTTGNLTSITAPSGEILSYTYDGSLLKQESWSGPVAGSVSRTFDSDFAVASQSVNSTGTVTFAYDPDKLLTHAGDLTLTPRADNGLLSSSSIGTVADAWTYDGFGQAATYSCTANSSPAYSYQITQTDKLGRIVERVETIQGVSHTYDYGYDAAGRLATVSLDGTQVSAYTYDGNGNRLTAQSPFLGSRTCTYDAQDRLTSCVGGASYLYTANGEFGTKNVGGQITTYNYDVLGNLNSVTLSDGTQLSYVIDGQNRRIGKKINGTQVQGFLYEGQLQIAAELDGANSVLSRFVYGSKANIPDVMVKGGVEYRIVSDVVGSPRIITNTVNGSIVQQMDFDEFGNVTNDTNPGFQPFGFAGGLYDRDLKLVRFGARDYDSETGRWAVKDLIRFDGGGTNLFDYLLGDPVNLIDELGLIGTASRPTPTAFPAVSGATQSSMANVLNLAQPMAQGREPLFPPKGVYSPSVNPPLTCTGGEHGDEGGYCKRSVFLSRVLGWGRQERPCVYICWGSSSPIIERGTWLNDPTKECPKYLFPR